ncbi:tRNA (adenosine(37)-N6)-threonylcarbamoyltransferase complex ATPase subunit type 1 TsaE [Saprospiraceae bacterium]|nr:tRNA (adenosine(37)-N6)-threonylcarbamoyltransferase complex ATPase subunit type 1 TsaE [Saprospiraceae bacterium]
MNGEIILKLDTLGDLDSVVKEIRSHLKYPLILFVGDLGAGKTTLIKELLVQMGCHDIGSSPSYSIINQYESGDGPIYHIDLYRMNSAEETFALGIEEIMYSGRPCFIEWPEIIKDYIEEDCHILKIGIKENKQREIRFS